tara:strand:- start:1137 stop:1580 length:444 start_codon:yes stop_codon:yes gene_type:complete
MIDFKIKEYKDLTKEELYDLLQLRSEVFVVEQDCVYQDIDGKDQKALHVLGYKDESLIAYTRIFKGGYYFDNASIGRVIVKEDQRKYGYGKDLMKVSIEAVSKHYNAEIIEISAQTYLNNFYSNLGFQDVGEGYLEDGIPHIRMIKK